LSTSNCDPSKKAREPNKGRDRQVKNHCPNELQSDALSKEYVRVSVLGHMFIYHQ